MHHIFLTLLLLVFIIAPTNASQPHHLKLIHEITLKNGLKILIKEDHRAPIVVSMIWYNVGAADEPNGLHGVSHTLEHMMFKGTKQYPQGKFSKIIANIGGQENAFTNYDYTAYFEKVPANKLSIALKLEADRMRNLHIDQESLNKELQVIREERRLRTDNNPQALTFEHYMAIANLNSPYHYPIIGWMHDLKNLQLADVKAWYENFYAPNNATLVIIGDVTPNKAFKLATHYFQTLPKRPTYMRKTQVEPRSLGTKTVQVNLPAKLPMIILGYTVPSIKTVTRYPEDIYALTLIAGIFDANESSRLTKNLIHQKNIASFISVNYNLITRYQTQFIINAIPTQQSNNTMLLKAIQQEITNLKQHLVTTAELERVKTQIIAQKTFDRDSVFIQAMELGILTTLNLNANQGHIDLEKIQTITSQQIQDTAKRYFNDNNLTIAYLNPQSLIIKK